jgi:hypothetical protein
VDGRKAQQDGDICATHLGVICFPFAQIVWTQLALTPRLTTALSASSEYSFCAFMSREVTSVIGAQNTTALKLAEDQASSRFAVCVITVI